LKNKSKNY